MHSLLAGQRMTSDMALSGAITAANNLSGVEQFLIEDW
jgi:hypothetical protein